MSAGLSANTRTIVIGLGNPILSDDSVGIKIARALKERLSVSNSLNCPVGPVDIIEIYAGGMRLMDAMVGYDRAIIADAVITGNTMPGTITCIMPSDICTTRNLTCTHDSGLSTALEMGSMLGLKLPSHIRIWGIEAKDVETFSEDLTDEVKHAVPCVVDQICSYLFSHQKLETCKVQG